MDYPSLEVMAWGEIGVSQKYLDDVWKKRKSRKIVWRGCEDFSERTQYGVALEMVGIISGLSGPSEAAKKRGGDHAGPCC